MIDSLIAFTFGIIFGSFGTIYLITHFGGKRK
jgi:hypothetical protein|nr:MAG TPA: hypothetical protein [Caudoviricetes sp.]DAW09231.1 MAG TPA: hypothetical protein [Caudoviricetes sp.]